jgi:hypothetical protein
LRRLHIRIGNSKQNITRRRHYDPWKSVDFIHDPFTAAILISAVVALGPSVLVTRRVPACFDL